MKRVFLIVLDSLGIGALPDAKDFGDNLDVNTLKSISKSEYFNTPNLKNMGFFNIEGIDFLDGAANPKCAYARMLEASNGKDTTTGHWEIAGIISEKPFPTYPNGFPEEIIDEFSKQSGKGILCNKPYSGTKVIDDYGDEHLKTGDLIVYTSADSVFQIAAHESIVPISDLYKYCEIARNILIGENAVGRVIARPFTGESGNFTRTANRRDFSLLPPSPNLLTILRNSGLCVISVGKIYDIFAGSAISESYKTHSNDEGMQTADTLADTDFNGLCFINLVDFDMLYGHRNNPDLYAKAVSEFDNWCGEFMKEIKHDDLLIITADHGCDPGDLSTDHTREYVPMLAYNPYINPINLGTRESFCDISKTILDLFGIPNTLSGKSFFNQIIK